MKILKLAFLLIAMLGLGGCWDNMEVEETAYVLGVGFDLGKNDNLEITFQIANPKELAGKQGGGQSGDKAYIFNTIEAPLPIAGYTLLNTIHTRQVSFLHTKVYIFSEELAKKGIQEILYPLVMYRETRGSSYAFVCRGKAQDLMSKQNINLESNPARQFELLEELSQKLGFTSMITLAQFYEENKNHHSESFLPLLGVNKEKNSSQAGNSEGGEGGGSQSESSDTKETFSQDSKTSSPEFGDYLPGDMPEKETNLQFIGTAIFVDHKMKAELTGDETRYLLMLQGILSESVLVIPDPVKPQYQLGITLRQREQPEWDFALGADPLQITGKIYLEVILNGIASEVNFANYAHKEKLEKSLIAILEKENQALIHKAQKEYKADIFRLWEKAKWKFIDNAAFDNYQWSEKFKQAKIDFQIEVEVRQTGKQIRTK